MECWEVGGVGEGGRREGGGVVGCGAVSEELCVCVFHGSGVNGVEARV